MTSQGGTLNVDAGAKLLIDNITQGEYAITSGFSVSNVQGWNGDNLSTPDNLIGLVLGKDADGSMKVQATFPALVRCFPGLSSSTRWMPSGQGAERHRKAAHGHPVPLSGGQ
ncbi:MAG: hypothetical protein ACLRWP_19265 [Bilophila wadsworthia]